MTVSRSCCCCGDLITDPGDAVYLGYNPGNSGPGWDIWAHRDHTELAGPDPDAARILGRVLIQRALRGEGK